MKNTASRSCRMEWRCSFVTLRISDNGFHIENGRGAAWFFQAAPHPFSCQFKICLKFVLGDLAHLTGCRTPLEHFRSKQRTFPKIALLLVQDSCSRETCSPAFGQKQNCTINVIILLFVPQNQCARFVYLIEHMNLEEKFDYEIKITPHVAVSNAAVFLAERTDCGCRYPVFGCIIVLMVLVSKETFSRYRFKNRCTSRLLPRTKIVSSAVKQWAGPGSGSNFPPCLVARTLMRYFCRTASSTMVFPTQEDGTAVSKMEWSSVSSM